MTGSSAVLALDVGTSSVRAALYDQDGQAIPQAASRVLHHVDYLPDGGVQTDADALLGATAAAIDHCLSGPFAGPVAAVGISCFWHSLVGTDGALRPVTPLLIWADTRSAADVPLLARQLDTAAVRGRTGCPLHPSYPSVKLHWIRRARPTWWAQARHWLSFGEYLTHWLTGELAASVSMASGSGLYDQAAGCWDATLCAAVGLEEGKLPDVVDLHEPDWRCRHLGRWAALRGVRVLLPAGDGACNNVGSGCVGADRVSVMIGTSAASRVLRTGGPWTVPPALWQYRLDRRRGLVGGALSNGGNLYRWLLETLRLDGSAAPDVGTGGASGSTSQAPPSGEGPAGDEAEAAIARLPPDGHGLTFLPLFAGERSPGWAPGAFGGILGLRESTTALEILRAGMEAVAVRMAAVVAEIEGALAATDTRRPRLIGSGGGFWHSGAWAQILADAIGRDIERSAEPEASSRGAGLLALESLGVVPDVADLAPPVAGGVQSDPARHPAYEAAWRRQRRFYGLLRGDALIGFGPSAPGAVAQADPSEQ